MPCHRGYPSGDVVWGKASPAGLCPPAPGLPCRASPRWVGDTPAPTSAPGMASPCCPCRQVMAKPRCRGQCLWGRDGLSQAVHGASCPHTAPQCAARVGGRRRAKRCLRGRALPAGSLLGGCCRRRELVGSPRTGAGGSLRNQRRARVFPRATAHGAARHGPGKPLFSSGLREFPPLPQLPPTLHTKEVPSFIWQRCRTQFVSLLSLALARAPPARPQLPPSR